MSDELILGFEKLAIRAETALAAAEKALKLGRKSQSSRLLKGATNRVFKEVKEVGRNSKRIFKSLDKNDPSDILRKVDKIAPPPSKGLYAAGAAATVGGVAGGVHLNSKRKDGTLFKKAGVGDFLGKLTGISKYRAGKAALEKATPRAKENLLELKDLLRDLKHRKQELKNRASAFDINVPWRGTPKRIKNLTTKELKKEMPEAEAYISHFMKSNKDSMGDVVSASRKKREGVNRMWLTGGITSGVGLGATALALKSKKEEAHNNFKQALS